MRIITLLSLSLLLVLSGCSPPRAPESAHHVSFAGRLSRPTVQSEAVTELYAELRIAPGDVPATRSPTVNIALVIDTSGSMEGAALERARQAATRMISRLAEGDRVALVTFHTEVDVLVASTPLDDDTRKELVEHIGAMRAAGTTNLRSGLQAGLAQVQAHHDPAGINRVVLLGDGVPNDARGIVELAQSAGRQNVSITSFGLGIDYDEALMGAIAQGSGGRFHYIDDPDKMAGFFDTEVLRLQEVYARNTQLNLTLGPDVELEVLGHAASGGRVVSIPLGDLSQRDSLDVLVRLTASGRRAGAPVEIVDAVLSYLPPGSETRVERRVYLGARSSDDAEAYGVIDAELEYRGTLAEAANATLKAVTAARSGDRDGAHQVIDRTVVRLKAEAARGNEQELGQRVMELQQLRDNLPAAAPPPKPATMSLDFADDVMPAAPAPMESPEQQHQVKQSHDRAMQSLY